MTFEEYVKAEGITFKTLAYNLGVSYCTIGTWRRGTRRVTPIMAKHINQMTNGKLSVEYLLSLSLKQEED